MADRIEREIEEILARLDEQAPPENAGKPISLMAHKDRKREAVRKTSSRAPRPGLSTRLTPASLLVVAAIAVVGGLVLSNAFSPLIWVSFAGVVLFLGAFAWSFMRDPGKGGIASQPKGGYWRDRWIEYEPKGGNVFDRIKRRFRR